MSGGQIGGSIDAMVLSLDAYPNAVQPQLAIRGWNVYLGVSDHHVPAMPNTFEFCLPTSAACFAPDAGVIE